MGGGDNSHSNNNNDGNNDDGIKNFRPVAGIPDGTIYRCASTDVLGKKMIEASSPSSTTTSCLEWTDADRCILQESGLILDLRSDVERNDIHATTWIQYVNNNNNTNAENNDGDDDDKKKKIKDQNNPSSSILDVYSVSSNEAFDVSCTTQQSTTTARSSSSEVNDTEDDTRFGGGPVMKQLIQEGTITDPTRQQQQSPSTPSNSLSLATPRRRRNRRFVVRVDVLDPKRFMSHVDNQWIASASLQTSIRRLWYKLVSGEQLHNLRMKFLNERGLAGLNEAIIESGRYHLCWSLKAITVYRETLRTMTTMTTASPATAASKDVTVAPNDDNNNNDGDDRLGSSYPNKIVIHCVQGKDRTGMLAMLLQIIMGVPDDVIIEDYYRSNEGLGISVTPSQQQQASLSSSSTSTASSPSSSAAAETAAKGKLDRRIFSGTTREAMIVTLEYVRSKYGSFDNYFESIGFDRTWQDRLRASLSESKASPTSLSRSDVSITTSDFRSRL